MDSLMGGLVPSHCRRAEEAAGRRVGGSPRKIAQSHRALSNARTTQPRSRRRCHECTPHSADGGMMTGATEG